MAHSKIDWFDQILYWLTKPKIKIHQESLALSIDGVTTITVIKTSSYGPFWHGGVVWWMFLLLFTLDSNNIAEVENHMIPKYDLQTWIHIWHFWMSIDWTSDGGIQFAFYTPIGSSEKLI